MGLGNGCALVWGTWDKGTNTRTELGHSHLCIIPCVPVMSCLCPPGHCRPTDPTLLEGILHAQLAYGTTHGDQGKMSFHSRA